MLQTPKVPGNKFQPFHFNSYVEFFEFISDEHKPLVSALKDIIYDTIPDVKEKLSWNVPFFYKNRTICFIWPGSVPWGKKTYKGVQLGFAKGYLMKPNDFLEMGNRKQIYTKTFYSLAEIETHLDTIILLLSEADELDKKT